MHTKGAGNTLNIFFYAYARSPAPHIAAASVSFVIFVIVVIIVIFKIIFLALKPYESIMIR